MRTRKQKPKKPRRMSVNSKHRPPEVPVTPDTSRVCFGFSTGGGRRNIRKPLTEDE